MPMTPPWWTRRLATPDGTAFTVDDYLEFVSEGLARSGGPDLTREDLLALVRQATQDVDPTDPDGVMQSLDAKQSVHHHAFSLLGGLRRDPDAIHLRIYGAVRSVLLGPPDYASDVVDPDEDEFLGWLRRR